MDCPECEGSGKIPGYRDNARVEPSVPKETLTSRCKKMLVSFLSLIKEYYRLLIGISLIFICACLIVKAGYDHDLEMMNHKHWQDNMGYVVVQYDNALEPNAVKCWVTLPRMASKHLDNPTCPHIIVAGPTMPNDDRHIENPSNLGWIEVPNRHDINGFAWSMGVKDPSSCIHKD